MKIIVIYGPTAVGKSSVAVELAKIIDAEIISADCMQIYKQLDIGSAKISANEMQNIKHHLIDIKSCDEDYSVYQFVQDCKQKIAEIKSRNKNIIIVGGTGLYIKALVQNYNYGETIRDDNLRNELNKKSCEELVNILNNMGQEVKQDDLHNKIRLIRYIEIAKSGKKLTKTIPSQDYIIFGLYRNREDLYSDINKRVDNMINLGLVNEVTKIYKLYKNAQCLKGIGYKELLPFIDGEKQLNDCIEEIKKNTRNYAKRQITFFNQFPNIIKIEVKNIDYATQEILKNIKDLT